MSCIVNSSNLQYFNAYHNLFTGGLPAITTIRPNLTYFAVEHNTLTGTVHNAFGKIFGNNIYLILTMFTHNSIDAPMLKYAYFENNQFTGYLPTHFGKPIELLVLPFHG